MSSLQVFTNSASDMYAEDMARHKRDFDVVQKAVMDGELFHRSVLEEVIRKGAIADLTAKTSIWIEEVARKHFPPDTIASTDKQPLLVGFQMYKEDFEPTYPPYVQMIQHDCAEPFDDEWHGMFDVVNVRFPTGSSEPSRVMQIVKNAYSLLKPGGLMQWLDRELLETRSSPPSRIIQRLIENFLAAQKQNGLRNDICQMVVDAICSVGTPEGHIGALVDSPAFDVVECMRFMTGTGDNTATVNDEISLAMRNMVLQNLMYFNQLTVLLARNEIRLGTNAEREEMLKEKVREHSDLDDEARSLLSMSLEEIKVHGLHFRVVARKL